MRNWIQRFMMGRYGNDKLNIAVLVTGVVFSVASVYVGPPYWKLSLMIVSYLIMGWALFRMLSRNTYRRYLENRKYLMFLQKLKDREHRYYDCPRCRQQVRVPRGKGKISITCPKCKIKFIRKT